jgi:hypothetical protein
MTTMKIRQIINAINKADHDCDRYRTSRNVAYRTEDIKECRDKWPHRTRESFRVDALKELFK